MLDRIEKLNPQLNAFLTITADAALEQARQAEKELCRGRARSLLHGVPVAVKDNIWTRGIRTTAGSKILSDFVPTEDAAAVERLRRAGAVVLGKTNLHEFAYGITTNNPHYGPTRNPWDTARIPGGSSGGSAAALAAGLCFAALGTDTGGSIRIPAALCGVVGLKPTFGLVSCYGVVPLCPTFDHIGPMARSVRDVALLLGLLAGRDPRDPATAARPRADYGSTLRSPSRARKRPLRLGWPGDYFWETLDEEVRRVAETAARTFEVQGAVIEHISLPHLSESVEASTHIALAEARRVHESAGYFPARAAEYSEEVRKRLEMGADVRAVDYLAALEARKQVQADFAAAFKRVDAIVAPTVPVTAPAIGESRVRIGAEEESVRSALIRLNRPANFTGLPAISVPCGLTRAGLPVGLQLIGRAFDEATLLCLASAYEQDQPWRTKHPPLA